MSNFANLTNIFEHMGLEKKQPKYHELQIEYPVLDLLPAEESVVPFLKPPSFSGYRERPDPSEYHLPQSGADFIVRLPLMTEMPSTRTPPEPVFIALMQLLAAPGRSLLQMYTYFEPEDGDHYIFRLLTERNGDLRNGDFQIVAENELGSIAWDIDYRELREQPWMRLCSNLINRVSDRAYFHVHERLKHYRWYNKQVAEEQWNFKDSFDPKRFFAAHLHVNVGSTVQKVYKRDLEGEGEGTFVLPCGHERDASIQELRASSIDDCLHVKCGSCGELLARKGDLWRYWLLLHRQTLKRAKFSVRELIWKRIEDEFPIGTQRVSLSSAVLHKALRHAAVSVIPPDSASTHKLHPLNSGNFKEIVTAFYSQLQGKYEVRRTSDEIFSELVEKLDEAVGRVESSGHEPGNLQSLPRAWQGVVHLWLTRATQLAGIPGYDGREPLTVFDNQASEDEGSVQEEEEDEEMDELDQLMKGAKLS